MGRLNHKRIAPVPTAVCPEELVKIDELCDSRPYEISRSQIMCLSWRFMYDKLQRGEITLETLFDKYLKAPLSPLSVAELAQVAADTALRQECIERGGVDADEFIRQALRFACESFAAFGYAWPDEGEQVVERLRA